MANKYSNHLHELIQSLSKAEKRYFNIFVNRHTAKTGTNNAEILFNILDKMEVYKEEIVLEEIKNLAISNKFSIAKARLYDTILKSLDAFYSEKSKEQQIRNELHYIEILYSKSLYKQCDKRILSAKKQAIKYNKKHLLAELILWQKKLIEKDNYQSITKKNIHAISEEEKEILEDLLIKSKLWEVKGNLFHKINQTGRARSIEEAEIVKQNIETKLKAIVIPSEKIRLSYLHQHIKSAYYFAIYNYSESLKSVLKTIEIIEQNTIEFSEEPNILLSSLTNGVYLALKTKNTQQVELLYDKLNNLSISYTDSGSNDLVLKLNSSIISLKLMLLKNIGNYSNSEEILSEAKDFIRENSKKINQSRLAYLYYNLAANYYIQEDYSEALKWINNLLNDIKIDKTQEIYSFAEILNLFIHIELNNNNLVIYTLKSTTRFLKTRNKMFKFESLILKFLRKIAEENLSFNKTDIYRKLKIQLEEVIQNPYENIPLEYFDYMAWVDSKLTKSKISILINSKNNNLNSFKF